MKFLPNFNGKCHIDNEKQEIGNEDQSFVYGHLNGWELVVNRPFMNKDGFFCVQNYLHDKGEPMRKDWAKNQVWKNNGWVIVISFIAITLAMIYQESLYGIFGEDNYAAIHTMMEAFIFTSALTIAIQAWMTFPHVLSSYRLWLGALFFSIGILSIFHMITYKGMPFFLSESSPYKATWFYMISRLTQALGLLIIILSNEQRVGNMWRWIAYSTASIYVLIWSVVVFYPDHLLPYIFPIL